MQHSFLVDYNIRHINNCWDFEEFLVIFIYKRQHYMVCQQNKVIALQKVYGNLFTKLLLDCINWTKLSHYNVLIHANCTVLHTYIHIQTWCAFAWIWIYIKDLDFSLYATFVIQSSMYCLEVILIALSQAK